MKTLLHRKKSAKNVLIGIGIIIAIALAGSGLLIGTEPSTNPSAGASAAYPADINSDGIVNISDVSILISNWGTSNSTSDINGDGLVNVSDLSAVITKWGTSPPATHPDATNTGVPAGVTLVPLSTAYPDATAKGYTVNAQGKVTINKDGEIYENVLFPNGVVVRGKNIIIRNSRITAGRASFGTSILGEPTSWADCRAKRATLEAAGQNPPTYNVVDANASTLTNLLIEDSEIAVNDYSIYINSFMGHDTTMRRVDISGGVDAIGTNNAYAATANFRLEDSWLHDLYYGSWSVGNYNTNPASPTVRMYCGYDAAHPEPTHNDGIQTHNGSNVYIVNNYINVKPVNGAQSNAGIMLNNTGDTHVTGNHFQYGTCSVNAVSGLTLPIEVSNNTFYGNNGATGTGIQADGNCAIIRPAAAGYIINNNLWENGTVVKLSNGG